MVDEVPFDVNQLNSDAQSVWSLGCVKPRLQFTRYNLLSNRFDNRVNVCIHDTTGCQTRCQSGCTTRFDNRFDNRLDVCLHDTAGCQTGCTTGTGLTTGCIV